MLSQGKELNALDFTDIIGGPLLATVNAQAKAAYVTANFINSVAFVGNNGPSSAQLKTAEFDFNNVLSGYSQSKLGTSGGGNDLTKLKVPLLTLIPIPYIRVEYLDIDLNVNLHDTTKDTLDNNFAFDSTVSGGESAGFIWKEHTSFKTTVSDRNTFQHSHVIDDTYSLQVHVHAVQAEVPGGMQQVLNIFNNVVQQQAKVLDKIMVSQVEEQTKQIEGAGTNSPSPSPSPTP